MTMPEAADIVVKLCIALFSGTLGCSLTIYAQRRRVRSSLPILLKQIEFCAVACADTYSADEAKRLSPLVTQAHAIAMEAVALRIKPRERWIRAVELLVATQSTLNVVANAGEMKDALIAQLEQIRTYGKQLEQWISEAERQHSGRGPTLV